MIDAARRPAQAFAKGLEKILTRKNSLLRVEELIKEKIKHSKSRFIPFLLVRIKQCRI